jgi:hypothetical protein
MSIFYIQKINRQGFYKEKSANSFPIDLNATRNIWSSH